MNDPNRIRKFYSNIFHQISSSYNPSILLDMKETLFELAHISLVLHSPNKSIPNKIVHDVDKWRKMLKLYFAMVEQEIKYLNSQMKFNRNPEMNEIFLKFTVDLCYLVRIMFDLQTCMYICIHIIRKKFYIVYGKCLYVI